MLIKVFDEHHQNVKRFGSRSEPTFRRSWTGSKLFAKMSVSRAHKLPQTKNCTTLRSALRESVSPWYIVNMLITLEPHAICWSKFAYKRMSTLSGPRREKNCLRWFANNKSADQPAHTRSLISDYVVRL